MPLDPKDVSRLWDMLDAARTTLEFTEGMRFDHFVGDRKTRNAVERNLEVLGEAARNVTAATREANPEIPWKSIIGFRNILAHEYGEIRHEVVWSIIQEKIPPLIERLKAMEIGNPPRAEDP